MKLRGVKCTSRSNCHGNGLLLLAFAKRALNARYPKVYLCFTRHWAVRGKFLYTVIASTNCKEHFCLKIKSCKPLYCQHYTCARFARAFVSHQNQKVWSLNFVLDRCGTSMLVFCVSMRAPTRLL